ncbi:VOC family protein [Shewanella sp. OMA3-2]|uniref:VOC family protein n=1 Tax=Shewanella sp. OMA3-2 TaxID=2908650 RepID=UPI001F17300B|nr:VOC family protein [Shewanella sp. OMA3-2]UJF20864.1 VOC family protein [Shewanella sp. OMA3-2]
MNTNPVGWFEIYVNDLARARKFYQSVLGINFDVLGDPNDDNIKMLSFPSDMEKYGATGALVQMEGFPAGGNSTLIYFACEDCAIEESKVVAAGGRVQRSKMSIGEYGFITLAMDTESNMFGLHSLK